MRLSWRAARAFATAPPGPWRRGDWAVALAIAAAVALRWGDRARYLLTWDAHTFALALERYDVNALRPHAPGYPVFVALARLVHVAVADHNEAYIALAMACAAAGVALAYAVGRVLLGRLVALVAAALLLCAPLVHIHAMTANAYTAEMAFAAAVAWAAWRCRTAPTRGNAIALALAFGVAVGVRQSLAFFLLPLVAWAALRPPWDVRGQARRLLPAAAAGALVGLAWFIPMAWASGGLATWRRANASQSEVVFERPVWEDAGMLAVNLERVQLYLRWELTALLPVLAVLVAAAAVATLARARPPPLPPHLREGPAPREALAFLALWALPALAFNLAVYSGYGRGPSGYMLVLLPALYLACAWAGILALRRLPWPRPAQAGAGLACALLAGAGLASHAHDAADLDYRVNDAWAEAWSHLPEAFPPANTTIVTSYNFAHLWFYYPDYQVYEFRPPGKAVGEVPDFLLIQEAQGREATPDWYDAIARGEDPGPHPLRNGTRHLVLFDFQLAGENGGERRVRVEHAVREAFLPNGWRVLVLDVVEGRMDLEDYLSREPVAA